MTTALVDPTAVSRQREADLLASVLTGLLIGGRREGGAGGITEYTTTKCIAIDEPYASR